MPHRPKPREHGALRFAAPPGLSASSDIEDESGPAGLSIVDLARRLQRLELLLFRLPEPDFEKLDAHILFLVGSSQTDMEPSALEIPTGCQVFDLSESSSSADEGATALECSTDSLREVKLAALSEDLEARIKDLDEKFCFMEQGKSTQAQLIIQSITDIVNNKFAAHAEEIQALRTFSARHDSQIEKCLDLLESCENCSKDSLNEPLPKKKEKKKGR